MRHLALIFISCIGLILLSGPAYGVEECLSAGESYDNLVLTPVTTRYLRRNKRDFRFPIPDLPRKNLDPDDSRWGGAKANIFNQNIQLEAFALQLTPALLGRKVEAFARGRLLLDFIVGCGDTSGESIFTTISFRTKIVGRAVTFLPGSTASAFVFAKVTDTVTKRKLDFRIILDSSVGGRLGKWKVIAKVPVPIPEGETTDPSLEESVTQTIAVPLIKGRKYTFEFRADARAIAGYGTSTGPLPPFGNVNFQTTLLNNLPQIELLGFPWTPPDLLGFENDPGIELLDFRIKLENDTSDDIANLRMNVEALRDSIVSLSELLENLDPSVGEQVSGLQELIAQQEEVTLILQENLSALESSVLTLQQNITLQAGDISALQNENNQIRSEIATIFSELEDMQSQINSSRESFNNHSHEYLTGSGNGHNNTKASTSSPN